MNRNLKNEMILLHVFIFYFDRNTHTAFDSLDFSKKWYHIALQIERNESSLFVDGEMHNTYANNIEFSQTVDVNITLGGKFNILGKIIKQTFI